MEKKNCQNHEGNLTICTCPDAQSKECEYFEKGKYRDKCYYYREISDHCDRREKKD